MKKLEALKKLYALYDELSADYDTACKKGCPSCCTDQVIITSLEGRLLLLHMEENSLYFKEIIYNSTPAGYRPETTINSLASLCLKEIEPPEDEPPPAEVCPFLKDRECPVYEARPFSCRSMCSTTNCEDRGLADMPDLIISMNQIFMQSIEMLDRGGLYGNMLDILKQGLEEEADPEKPDSKFLINQPIPGFLVPPEHERQMAIIVEKIKSIMFA